MESLLKDSPFYIFGNFFYMNGTFDHVESLSALASVGEDNPTYLCSRGDVSHVVFRGSLEDVDDFIALEDALKGSVKIVKEEDRVNAYRSISANDPDLKIKVTLLALSGHPLNVDPIYAPLREFFTMAKQSLYISPIPISKAYSYFKADGRHARSNLLWIGALVPVLAGCSTTPMVPECDPGVRTIDDLREEFIRYDHPIATFSKQLLTGEFSDGDFIRNAYLDLPLTAADNVPEVITELIEIRKPVIEDVKDDPLSLIKRLLAWASEIEAKIDEIEREYKE